MSVRREMQVERRYETNVVIRGRFNVLLLAVVFRDATAPLSLRHEPQGVCGVEPKLGNRLKIWI